MNGRRMISGGDDRKAAGSGSRIARSAIGGVTKDYLLSGNHPAKPALDAIFRSIRATKDELIFQSSGFNTLFKKSRSFIRVASHPSLPGYILKVYLDDEQRQKHNRPGWQWLVRRCEGAENIRKIIQQKEIEHFRVPGKWLYPLPPRPRSISGYQPFLLIVEDMDLVSREENEKAWKTMITREHLDELFSIVTGAGGSSYRPDNIWLTRHGEFAFIDTEYPRQQFDFNSISPYLSPSMRKYWNSLVRYR
jgi:hypothetical protein